MPTSDPGQRLYPATGSARRTAACLNSLEGRLAGVVLLSLAIGGGECRIGAQAVPAPTVSILTASGTQTYQLTCSVSGPAISGVVGPTETVAFTDATAGQTLGTAPLSIKATAGTFGTPRIFPVGNLPVSIAVGDFNGDGKLDVAFGDAGGIVSLLLGDGDGTFQAPATFSTPAQLSFSMAAGDFNGDGKLDLAVADWHSDNIYILLGNGNGTFQAPQAYPNSAGPYGEMIAADVDGDGKLDLVITDFNDSEISVLLGNGDGTFKPAIVTQTDPYPGGVAAADFNGDGKLDLVVTSESAVSILPGNGDGTFGEPNYYPTLLGASPEGIAIADFNGDGKTDIAVASTGGTYVLLGNGDGTFDQPSVVSSVYPASYIAASDFNDDGKIDLVISGYEANDVEIFLGNGDGSFTWYESLADGGDEPGPLAPGDFSGNELPDLVIGNMSSGDASVLLYNTVTASGTLSSVVLSTEPPPSHNVQCSYGGDSNYASSTSNLVALIAEPAPAPVYYPAGGTYNSVQAVSITDATSGAAVYYTTDGSTPTQKSTPYTSPIRIATSETLSAIAYTSGFFLSSVAAATYKLQVAAPVIKPASGTFHSAQTVTITDATSDAAIYYTTDGSTPTIASTRYSSPISVVSNQTIEAISVAAGFLNSAVATRAYKIVISDYTVTPNPAEQTVTAGESATFSLTVTPTGGFSSAVTFSCSGLPAESNCLFNPGSVKPAGGPTSTMLSISTRAATTSRDSRPTEPRAPWRNGGAMALAGVLGIFFVRRRQGLRVFRCALVLVGATLCSGCASIHTEGGGNSGTPPGIHTITVSAASSGEPAKTLQLTLVVK